MPESAPPAYDFALLQAGNRSLSDRSRRTLWWMLGLALLVVSAVLALAWYLDNFETEEEERRRGADAQWLEQTVQFHFRRLEDDTASLTRLASLEDEHALPLPGMNGPHTSPMGLLWRTPGVVLAHGWMPVQPLQEPLQRWQHDMAQHPDNQRALHTLEAVVQGLRRPSYAGPLREATGHSSDRLWLAVPYFEGNRFIGQYAVLLSMQAALDMMLPAWFLANQTVRLVSDSQHSPDTPHQPHAQGSYRTVMNLPGTDLMLEVIPQGPQASAIPRLFFMVALLFLLGMLVSLAALRRDIVKRQQVQQRLLAEVALRTAMERSVTIGMRAWDMQGRILYVNQAFCTLVGYSATELLGQSAPLPYWPDEHVEELTHAHYNVLHQGTQAQGIEAQFRHRDGRLVDVLIHEAPLHAADGTPLGWMSSVLDISERKRAQQLAALQQEKLEASGRLVAVGEVASTLAHELNQPLGALASFANGLLNRLRSSSITLEDMEPVVQRMAQLAERAGGVIQRVNAFARQRELNLTRVDLTALARRAGAGAQEAQETPLELLLPAQPLWVQADALLLEHLVHNLCGNALLWAQQGTGRTRVQLRLSCTPDPHGGTSAVLSVADSGPGVPEEARARIFDAFFSTKAGGMGMGLAICRSIAEAHHSRVVVDQDPELGGAVFSVTLPLQA